MYVRYDALNRQEPLILTLCNPGSVYSEVNFAPTKVVGILSDTSDEELCLNFNQMSQLNFRITLVKRDDPYENAHIYKMYKAVQARRLLFVTGIGYFVISDISESIDDDGVRSKDVRAESVEYEIQNKKVPYIADDTYRFITDISTGTTGLLDQLVTTLPAWIIGHVDQEVAQRYRTFEDVDVSTNILSFMIDNMQDAYECIFLFDPIKRIINVYDQSNYVRKTNILITKEDLIQSIDIEEQSDNLYTAMSVTGDDNISIVAINPIGTNVLYRFDSYLDWMSPTLSDKVAAWQDLVDDAKSDYYDMNLEYYTKMEEASNTEMEMQRLNIQLTMYRRCRDNIVAESSTNLVDEYNAVIVDSGGTPIHVYQEIADTLADIDSLIAECESEYESASDELDEINEELSEIKSDIDSVHDDLAMERHFTAEEYDELANYMYEGSYKDEYVTITDIMSYTERFEQMRTLYDRAYDTLEKASKPTQEFSLDVENFIFSKEFEKWGEQIETGCLINVEVDDNDIAALFLSNMTVNYEDKSLSMTFGNRFNKFDPKSLFDDVLGNVSKSANTLSYVKDIIYPIKTGELNSVKEALDISKDLTMKAALTSTDEEVVIDGSGLTIRKRLDNGTFDPRQIKIVGRSIVFTDDAWKTSKVAVGEISLGDDEFTYGVNGETIIGDIIIGNNLHILDNNGNDLLTVVDGKISAEVSDIKGRTTALEQNSQSLSIRVQSLEDTDGEVDHVKTANNYTFDSNGLNISRDGDEIKNVIDNTGMYVSRSGGASEGLGDAILTANNEGVVAINLTSKQYLITGKNSRFEDYGNTTDSNRTACFYIGE